jgi:hypothetical protein
MRKFAAFRERLDTSALASRITIATNDRAASSKDIRDMVLWLHG